MAFCQGCGNELAADWKACPKCGREVGQPARESAQPRAAAPAKKKGNAGRIILGIIGGLIVLGIISAAMDGGDKKNTGSNSTDTGDTSANTSGVSYPDQQPKDKVAQNNTVELNGMVLTLSNMRRIKPDYSEPAMCGDMALKNNSGKSLDYNTFDFKLQQPSGDVRSFDIVVGQENSLESGVLIAGGSKTGTVCFNDKGEKGQFVLIYKPNAFKDDRGVWLFNMA